MKIERFDKGWWGFAIAGSPHGFAMMFGPWRIVTKGWVNDAKYALQDLEEENQELRQALNDTNALLEKAWFND